MRNPLTGVLLRLLGPLIEIVCLILLMRIRGQGRTIAGLPAEYPLYAGLALGFGLVIVGLTLFRATTTRTGDRPDRPSLS